MLSICLFPCSCFEDILIQLCSILVVTYWLLFNRITLCSWKIRLTKYELLTHVVLIAWSWNKTSATNKLVSHFSWSTRWDFLRMNGRCIMPIQLIVQGSFMIYMHVIVHIFFMIGINLYVIETHTTTADNSNVNQCGIQNKDTFRLVISPFSLIWGKSFSALWQHFCN